MCDVCDDESLSRWEECVICCRSRERRLCKNDRVKICPTHHANAFVAFCGEGEFVCRQCEEEGWYSTAGDGGGVTQHINHKTGEEREPPPRRRDVIDF